LFQAWRVEAGGRPAEPLKEGVEPEAKARAETRQSGGSAA
jgi:hypothetical protein